ncbi:NUDIX domain-containing protein [Candidatus Woesearchaeota archaeon CG_4_10_14_0_2_um_filter_33_13]|nr:MAG: NUDIX domain-containing protein [Candidatus Woesearchaeota archaeon CG_4_10_14_0_2_um_filter_33_13]
MINFRVAAKSFVINNNNQVLLIKRRSNDVMKPGMWEIPGGRLELGEDPHQGVIRETKEETNLDIDVKQIMDVRHFTRSDDQTITMLVFLCKALNEDVKLSEEHQDFKWMPVEKAKEQITEFFHKTVDTYINLEMKKLI